MAKTSNVPGRKAPQGKYSAFIPDALPPAVDWTPQLIRLLSYADRLIGKLAGEAGRLPNPPCAYAPIYPARSRAIQ
jgi:hypothetical protein